MYYTKLNMHIQFCWDIEYVNKDRHIFIIYFKYVIYLACANCLQYESNYQRENFLKNSLSVRNKIPWEFPDFSKKIQK